MNEYSDSSTSFDFSDKEKLEMLENWFQKRTEMTSRALKLLLVPVIGVLLFGLAFFSTYYIVVPQIVSLVFLGLLAASLLSWIICLFAGGGIFKKVRIGDSIMHRKIRSSSGSEKILT